MKVPAAAERTVIGRSGKQPEGGMRKTNPKVTIEDEEDAESESESEDTPVTTNKIGKPRRKEGSKGVRFQTPVASVMPERPRERPYVAVPPLKTAPMVPFKPVDREAETLTRKPRTSEIPVIGREPSYRNKAPIEDDEALQRVMEELLNTRFTTSLKDLASVSIPAREYLKRLITKKRVAASKAGRMERRVIEMVNQMEIKQQDLVLQMCHLLELEEHSQKMESRGSESAFTTYNQEEYDGNYIAVEDLPPARMCFAQGLADVPDGSLIVEDPVEQYYNLVDSRDKPLPVLVARDSLDLRTVFPVIMNGGRAECLLDSGSQICSMSHEVASHLGLRYNPDIVIHLQSANRTMTKTLGLAKNVRFDFDGVMAFLQVHIMRNPAYTVLLGRPFDVTMSSIIRNSIDGDQTVTLHDPNTRKQVTLETYERGKPPEHVESQMWWHANGNFWNSRSWSGDEPTGKWGSSSRETMKQENCTSPTA
jgi:hypothetical protein